MPLEDQLRELFRLDQQVRGLRGRMDASLRRQKAQQQKLDQLNRQQEELQQQIRHNETRANTLEHEAGDAQGKADRLREQMNSIHNHKEYSAMLVEVSSLEDGKSKLEEQALEHMNETEQLKQQRGEVQERITQQQKLVEQSSREVQSAREEVGGSLEEATGERDAVAERIPPDARQAFDRLADAYDGEALAPVEEADRRRREYHCGGCFIQLPIERVNALLKRTDQMVVCPNCNRILYLDEQTRASLSPRKSDS